MAPTDGDFTLWYGADDAARIYMKDNVNPPLDTTDIQGAPTSTYTFSSDRYNSKSFNFSAKKNDFVPIRIMYTNDGGGARFYLSITFRNGINISDIPYFCHLNQPDINAMKDVINISSYNHSFTPTNTNTRWTLRAKFQYRNDDGYNTQDEFDYGTYDFDIASPDNFHIWKEDLENSARDDISSNRDGFHRWSPYWRQS